MSITLDFWQLLGALASILVMLATVIYTAGVMLVNQFQKRLDEKFSAQETSRVESQKHWDSKFQALEQASANDAKEWQRVERELLKLTADLPINYVRRDDYIRNQTIIEAKIDGLAVRIENAILKGERNG